MPPTGFSNPDDMANECLMKPIVYGRLSFLDYDLNRPYLDTEWLLSTLFDASLLSTSKPPETAASFFLWFRNITGNHIESFLQPPLDTRPQARNDLFIILSQLVQLAT
jgi:hypothetical protein